MTKNAYLSVAGHTETVHKAAEIVLNCGFSLTFSETVNNLLTLILAQDLWKTQARWTSWLN